VFDRLGIDPFADRFEVTLTAEGTVRGSGGLRIVDENCETGVGGLFACGDVATREWVTGAASGGGAINSSWALSTGQWAGRAAAKLAKRSGRRAAEAARATGRAGLCPTGRARDLSPSEIVREAQREILPYDKGLFRRAATMSASLMRLDGLWDDVREGLAPVGDGAVAAREAAAVVATAR
jgi:succinate dehydrogenase/fumarate reductase flavoprotein subunit